ncbi:LlaJI family restriction endonuclease [Corynebacterium glucuronolyticum]|uniref:LlaJI family restriction endonuclease n=1 Tax=Corynebacterium glucuronolyticum TaxID=39791 RepID=UPI00223B2602|nr:LlaJI family restriction endonuclease [Corynebacterium glucuronolyticum]MCT1563580.1 LlaJI family restriction endonuclease [Corynebacterium glucuronolyticum]
MVVREGWSYSTDEIWEMLEDSTTTLEEVKRVLARLQSAGFLKRDVTSDRSEYAEEILFSHHPLVDVKPEYRFRFDFVGVLVVENFCVKVYPKYVSDPNAIDLHLGLALRVLKEMNKTSVNLHLHEEAPDLDAIDSPVSLMLFLIKDYVENGLYIETTYRRILDGNGNIDWDRTISHFLPVMVRNRPIYPEYISKDQSHRDTSYFKDLHLAVLGEILTQFARMDLFETLRVPPIEIVAGSLADLGSVDQILYRIRQRYYSEFNDRNRILLSSFELFLEFVEALSGSESIQYFGTTAFNLVWEEACGEVFGNQLKKPLDFETFGAGPNKRTLQPSRTIESYIERPKWAINIQHGETRVVEGKRTFKPDIVTIDEVAGRHRLVILDAKYYLIRFSHGRLLGEPGVEDIAKQFLYALSLQGFASDNAFDDISNCFIFPNFENHVVDLGSVSLSILTRLGLAPVQLRLLPVEDIFNAYLTKQQIGLDYLSI